MIKSKKIIAALATIAMLFFGAFALCLTNTEQNRAFANETTTSAVLMVDGAEVRISTENSGLRFIGQLSKSYFTDTETPTLKDGVTVGMLLGKGEVTADDLTLENVSSKDLKNAEINNWDISRSNGDYINFNVAMTSIPETDYGVSVIARAYVTENGATTYSENACTRSIAEVADAALAENAITDKLNDTAKGICQGFVANGATALTVDNLTVLDGKVRWDENSNAKGYIVSYNDEIKQVKDANELLLTLADIDKNVKVVAYGDGGTYSRSTIAEKTVHALAEKELANFNNESYENDLIGGGAVEATYTDFYQMNGADIKSVTPKYESNITDSTNGALLISPIVSAYAAGGQRHAVFTVNLQRTLNLADGKGIKICIQYKENSHPQNSFGNIYFKLVGDEKSEGYLTRFASATDSADTTSPQTGALTAGEWIELAITNDQLKEYYSNETDKLYFAFVTTNSSNASGGYAYTVSAYLDCIKYYNPPAAPTGLKIKDGTLSWDAVAGATSYVIECNGSTNEVTGTSYALSTITSDCTVSVYAKNAEGTSLASTINYHCLAENEIANFNNATYESDVVGGGAVEATYKTFSQSTSADINSVTPKYESDVTGSTGGAVLINPIITAYQAGGARHAVFTVNLRNTIDMENYEGIKIRIQYKTCTNATALGNVYFKLLGDEKSEGYLTRFSGAGTKNSPDTTSPQTEALTAGEWVELTITNEQLKAYYASGTDKLYFAFVTESGSNAAGGFAWTVSAYLDYIKYYTTD